MPFPETPRLMFEENPLEEVICQLRFPTILAIAAELPSTFQDKIRDTYPGYRRKDGGNLPPDIARLMSDLAVTTPVEAVSHHFSTEDEECEISLTPDFLAITYSRYNMWSEFRTELELAKTALEEIYRPAFYTRLGLRYRDAVNRKTLGLEEQWKELLNPSVLGLLGADPEEVRQAVRAVKTEALLQLPDIEDGVVRLAYGLTDTEKQDGYALDMDFFTTRRTEVNDVFEVLDAFHRKAGNLFRWAITPKLRESLRPRPLD